MAYWLIISSLYFVLVAHQALSCVLIMLCYHGRSQISFPLCESLRVHSRQCYFAEKQPKHSFGFSLYFGCFSTYHACNGKDSRNPLYTPSFVHIAPGTAGTSGISGAGHFLLHCELSPALQREGKLTSTRDNTHEFMILKKKWILISEASCYLCYEQQNTIIFVKVGTQDTIRARATNSAVCHLSCTVLT